MTFFDSENSTVLIVGGGPVGLTLAWLLDQAGIDVAVFEKESSIVSQLRASTFHPPTLDMFDASGITQELIDRGRITPTWQIRMHDTGDRAQFDLAVLDHDTAHPYRLQCHQSELSHALYRRLPANTVRFDNAVEAVGQDPNGVWLRTNKETVRGAVLVGCDGARSLVRKAIGGEFAGGTYPDNTILVTTDFAFDDWLTDLSGVNYIWKRGGTYSLLKLPDVWRISLHPLPGQSPEDALKDDSILAQTKEIIPDAPPLNIIEKRIYRVHHRVAEHYRNNRLFIAGDAAHLNSPKGGMGLNGGIHDAFLLAELLGMVNNGEDPDILDRYQRRRRPIARDEIIAQADANRTRMNTTDQAERLAHLHSLQAIAKDADKCREFLLKSSMITGLRRAAAID